MGLPNGALNLCQRTILVAAADVEPQVKDDVMCQGLVKLEVRLLLEFVPEVKILVGMLVFCVQQMKPHLDWYFVIDHSLKDA